MEKRKKAKEREPDGHLYRPIAREEKKKHKKKGK
jgi:hypothetical protein